MKLLSTVWVSTSLSKSDFSKVCDIYIGDLIYRNPKIQQTKIAVTKIKLSLLITVLLEALDHLKFVESTLVTIVSHFVYQF